MNGQITQNSFLQSLQIGNQIMVSFKDVFFDSLLLNEISNLKIIEKSICFERCTFTGIVDFSQIEFKEEVIFNECVFKNNAIFTFAHFYKCAYFYKCSFEKDVLFDHSIWESFGQFAFSQFHGICSFAFSLASGFLNFKGIKFYTKNAQLDLYCSHFDKHANFSDSEIEYVNLYTENARENARIIKHHCLNTNDKVLALKFHKYEMNALLKQTNTSIQDKVILYLNRISNNHGESWIRALLFLLYTSITLFLLFYFRGIDNAPFVWGWESFDCFLLAFTEGLKYYLIMLNPAHSFKDIDLLSLNIYGYFVDALSRIFISYAIYQFVSAYRKHGQNIK
jgi:hypothetical protein